MYRPVKAPSLLLRMLWSLLVFVKWFALSTLIWFVVILGFAFYNKSQYQPPSTGVFTTAHATIINKGVAENDAEEVGKKLEEYYDAIVTSLGVTRMPHVIVYLYPKDSIEFLDEYAQAASDDLQGFVDGTALDTLYVRWAKSDDPDRDSFEEITTEAFVERVVLHEFSHLVEHAVLFEKALADGWVTSGAHWQRKCAYSYSSYCRLPKWFSESVAQYESQTSPSKDLLTEFEARASTLSPTTFNKKDMYTYGRLVGEFIHKTFGEHAIHNMIVHNANTVAALDITEAEFNERFRTYASDRMKGILLQYNLTGQVIF